MRHTQEFSLPEGEIPATVVSVVITQSGRIFLAHPLDIPLIGLVSILAGGIQLACSPNTEQIDQEAFRIQRPNLIQVPKKLREN